MSSLENNLDFELKTRCIICSLFIILLLPITFQLTSSRDDIFQTDLFAYIATILVSGLILYIIHNLLKQHSHLTEVPKTTTKQKSIFNVFTSTSEADIFREKEANSRRKIDPKYFKPKYIIHELMSMWGQTYTVITWGTVWLIGGTIVGVEKLAQKIKTKCNRESHEEINNTSRGSGRNYSFASYSSYDSQTSRSGRSSLKRIRSWTKRSFASASKRFRFASSTGMPQLTET